VKDLAAVATAAVTVACLVPYVVGVLRGRLCPSPVSWLIWALGTALVAGAQASGGAGVGAWPLALSAAISAGVAVLAGRRAVATSPGPVDLACLAVAVTAGACWIAADDALLAVVLLTGLDLAGFGPILRRAWTRPEEESALFFLAGAFRNVLLLPALETLNATTVLFPAVVGAACPAA
jgi:hypothetical protein